MKKLRVFIIAAVSIDGFIAKKSDHFADWSSKEDKRLFSELTKKAGIMVMGNTTYSMFNNPLPNRKHIVYSRDKKILTNHQYDREISFTNLKPRELIDELSDNGYLEIAIIGGREIYNMFLESSVVDEIYLVVEPYIFGSGVSLFKEMHKNKLSMIESVKLNSDTILLHYKVK
jgi:dihydrofolate reductase